MALREAGQVTRQMSRHEFDRRRAERNDIVGAVAVVLAFLLMMAAFSLVGIDDHGDRVRDLSGGAACVEVAR